MRAASIFLCGTLLVHSLSAQTITGKVRDANGTPLNAALIVVKDDKGNVLSQAVSNTLGDYHSKATRGDVSVTCEVVTDSATTYSRNPDVEPLTIASDKATVDFTFYQVTASLSYWKTVGLTIGAKAANTPSVSQSGVLQIEWHKINSSGLPPDSKAAAAHELEPVPSSNEITDPTFKDYVKVDESTLSEAMHGDQKALAKLPESVATDVKASNAKIQ